MASAQLGEDFDVHGGGLDLIFPHHENERAQSEAAGERFARVWMHNGMLRLTGEKMSKSLGNIDGLAEALERVGRETLLVFFAQAHYRSPVDYSDTTLEQASATARWACARRCATPGAMPRAARAGFPSAIARVERVRSLRRLHGRRSRHAASARRAARLARAINIAVADGEAVAGRRGGRGRLCWCARWTFSASHRSTGPPRRPPRRSRWPRSAQMRAQQGILRSQTSCATASPSSDSRFATRRRGLRSCPSMADRAETRAAHRPGLRAAARARGAARAPARARDRVHARGRRGHAVARELGRAPVDRDRRSRHRAGGASRPPGRRRDLRSVPLRGRRRRCSRPRMRSSSRSTASPIRAIWAQSRAPASAWAPTGS